MKQNETHYHCHFHFFTIKIGWINGFIWCMYVHAHMIHMLTAAIITETKETLPLLNHIPLIGDFCGGWASHANVDVEGDSSNNSQNCENDCSDDESCFFWHIFLFWFYYKPRSDQLKFIYFIYFWDHFFGTSKLYGFPKKSSLQFYDEKIERYRAFRVMMKRRKKWKRDDKDLNKIKWSFLFFFFSSDFRSGVSDVDSKLLGSLDNLSSQLK